MVNKTVNIRKMLMKALVALITISVIFYIYKKYKNKNVCDNPKCVDGTCVGSDGTTPCTNCNPSCTTKCDNPICVDETCVGSDGTTPCTNCNPSCNPTGPCDHPTGEITCDDISNVNSKCHKLGVGGRKCPVDCGDTKCGAVYYSSIYGNYVDNSRGFPNTCAPGDTLITNNNVDCFYDRSWSNYTYCTQLCGVKTNPASKDTAISALLVAKDKCPSNYETVTYGQYEKSKTGKPIDLRRGLQGSYYRLCYTSEQKDPSTQPAANILLEDNKNNKCANENRRNIATGEAGPTKNWQYGMSTMNQTSAWCADVVTK